MTPFEFMIPTSLSQAEQLLAENPNPNDDEIRHYLVGNLCRCAAYPEIIEAVKIAAGKMQARGERAVPPPSG